MVPVGSGDRRRPGRRRARSRWCASLAASGRVHPSGWSVPSARADRPARGGVWTAGTAAAPGRPGSPRSARVGRPAPSGGHDGRGTAARGPVRRPAVTRPAERRHGRLRWGGGGAPDGGRGGRSSARLEGRAVGGVDRGLGTNSARGRNRIPRILVTSGNRLHHHVTINDSTHDRPKFFKREIGFKLYFHVRK